MKTLYLLRHGKSDWKAPYGRDHDRPLARRGVEAAALVGDFFSSHGWPECLLSSSAVRARTTLELAAARHGGAPPIEIVPDLYGAGVRGVLEVLARHAGDAASALTAGHEPTCSGLVQALTGARCRYPTATIARIDLHLASWQEAPERALDCRGELRWLLPPKALAHVRGRSEVP